MSVLVAHTFCTAGVVCPARQLPGGACARLGKPEGLDTSCFAFSCMRRQDKDLTPERCGAGGGRAAGSRPGLWVPVSLCDAAASPVRHTRKVTCIFATGRDPVDDGSDAFHTLPQSAERPSFPDKRTLALASLGSSAHTCVSPRFTAFSSPISPPGVSSTPSRDS